MPPNYSTEVELGSNGMNCGVRLKDMVYSAGKKKKFRACKIHEARINHSALFCGQIPACIECVTNEPQPQKV